MVFIRQFLLDFKVNFKRLFGYLNIFLYLLLPYMTSDYQTYTIGTQTSLFETSGNHKGWSYPKVILRGVYTKLTLVKIMFKVFLSPRMMSINNYDHTIGFISQNTYKLIYQNFSVAQKLTKVDLVIFQEPFLLHEGSSWFQGWFW